MAYKYTEYGSSYPAQGSYHDNSGYYSSNVQMAPSGGQSQKSKRESANRQSSFEPVRMYPSDTVRSPGHNLFNWHMFRTAFVSVFFAPCCGLIGLLYAILSYVDFQKGEHIKYGAKKNCSLGWSVTAIILGVLAYVGALVGGLVLYFRILNIVNAA